MKYAQSYQAGVSRPHSSYHSQWFSAAYQTGVGQVPRAIPSPEQPKNRSRPESRLFIVGCSSGVTVLKPTP
ncbi:MAG: hypothetical protein HC771_09575 [Synechococcales cyanobacterium CRU_2_2]|nr:hypothetical protein [Synechococcales cyanobacterium CRU_2_2]